MAKSLKHVGQLINTQKRVVVVFREVPDEPDNCLVVDTESLPDWMHDDVIRAVESPGAQNSSNFYDYAGRTVFTDGSNMLQSLHSRGLLQKQATANVMMIPNRSTKIRLDELNTIIREQTGNEPVVSDKTDDLGMAGKDVNPTAPNTNEVISDTDIAKNMLTQAEQFESEAKRLREEAFDMAPDLRPKRGRKSKSTEQTV
jgi:hypothetical protein